MIELVLGITIMGLCGLLVYEKYENRKERAKFINALLSRTPEQFRDLELTDKVKTIETPKPAEPDLVAERDLTDEQFAEMINKEIN